jgi:hypothetical protein
MSAPPSEGEIVVSAGSSWLTITPEIGLDGHGRTDRHQVQRPLIEGQGDSPAERPVHRVP